MSEDANATDSTPEVAPEWLLLPLSAPTETALETMGERLLHQLRERPEMSPEDLADVAWTLQVGRKAFRHRRVIVCRGREDAIACLEGKQPRRELRGVVGSGSSGAGGEQEARVAFLFPGLGNHHVGMARDLYRGEPRFRAVIDECAEVLKTEIGLDLREVLYPGGAEVASPAAGAAGAGVDLRAMLGRARPAPASPLEQEAAERLGHTEISQPAVFVIEYALARLLMDLGVRPAAMLGFSVGEYAAACLAGVMPLADALRVVARRAQRVGALPGGAMLALPVGEAAARELGGPELSVSAVAGPELTVLAGPEEAVKALEGRIAAQGLTGRRLQTRHAFHSRMMEPAVPALTELVRGVALRAPEIPFLSNVTGTWITDAEAVSPAYWGEHLRAPVRFGDGLAELWREPGRVLVEVGPGQTLASWALQHPAAPPDAAAVATLRHSLDRTDDRSFLLTALGRLWLAGAAVDWAALSQGRRRRVPLPPQIVMRQD